MTSRYKRPVGWRGESYRHYLASKGVTTRYLGTKGVLAREYAKRGREMLASGSNLYVDDTGVMLPLPKRLPSDAEIPRPKGIREATKVNVDNPMKSIEAYRRLKSRFGPVDVGGKRENDRRMLEYTLFATAAFAGVKEHGARAKQLGMSGVLLGNDELFDQAVKGGFAVASAEAVGAPEGFKVTPEMEREARHALSKKLLKDADEEANAALRDAVAAEAATNYLFHALSPRERAEVMEKSGERFVKHHGAEALAEMKESGMIPGADRLRVPPPERMVLDFGSPYDGDAE